MLPLLRLDETERGLRVALVDAGVAWQARLVIRPAAHDDGWTLPLAAAVSARMSAPQGRGEVAG
jgi:hypothetical protein